MMFPHLSDRIAERSIVKRIALVLFVLAAAGLPWLALGAAEAGGGVPEASSSAEAFAAAVSTDEGLVVVKAGRVITVSGEEIVDATIVIRDGKIEAIGTDVDYPFGSKVIDASDSVVMPGMINPVSRAARLTGGSSNSPQVTFEESFTLSPDDLRDVAGTGYTTLGIVPSGSGLPGRTLVVNTGGESREELIAEKAGPLLITFSNPAQDKGRVLQAFKAAELALEKIEKARAAFEAKQKKGGAAKPAPSPKPAPKPAPKPDPKPSPKPAPKPEPAPKPAPKPAPEKPAAPAEFKAPKIPAQVQPIVDLIQKKDGAMALVEFGMNSYQFWAPSPGASSSFLHWKQIPETYDFARAYRVRNSVVQSNSPFFVVPETDLELVAEDLGKEGAHVAIFPVVNHMPFTRNKFNLGLKLMRAGCKVVFIPESESWNQYATMRDNLTRMVRAGYPREEVLKTVTTHAAAMLGLSDRLGAIEKGFDANLVFLSGDPLAIDSKVERVMIAGRIVDARTRIR